MHLGKCVWTEVANYSRVGPIVNLAEQVHVIADRLVMFPCDEAAILWDGLQQRIRAKFALIVDVARAQLAMNVLGGVGESVFHSRTDQHASIGVNA